MEGKRISELLPEIDEGDIAIIEGMINAGGDYESFKKSLHKKNIKFEKVALKKKTKIKLEIG